MEVIGIICEYNPFHNGHIYHINKIKEMYPDSILIAIIDGYFTQRGEISLLNKYDKTILAINNNIDIVIELPNVLAIQSADNFAEKSITILNKLGVNKIIFGSETDDIKYLESIASKQFDKDFNNNIKYYLDKGYNYKYSLNKALNIDNIGSNDTLGISYIKAIIKNKYNIKYECIKRTNDYNDILSNDNIISASNIRNKINNNINIDKYIPNYNNIKISNIDYNKYFELLKYKIISDNNIDKYLMVNEGIDKRIKLVINKCNNIDDLIDKSISKRFTYFKIKRILLSIFIGIDNNINDLDVYVRILGFNNNGKLYLNSIKDNIDFNSYKNTILYNYELRISKLYDIITNQNNYDKEILNKPIIKS